MPSLQASVVALYSASVLDNATVCCRLLLQHTTPFPRINAYPEVDFRPSMSPA